MNKLYLFGAIIFICIAHFLRVVRWELFIRIYEKPKRKNLIQSLSWGYLLNYILPYKLGDLFRAWMSGKKMKNGTILGFSTVIVDRYMDILAVGIIFIALSFNKTDEAEMLTGTAAFYVLLAVILIYLLKDFVKRFFMLIAGLFNSKIELSLLCFAWALIWNFKNIFFKIKKLKLIATTIGMWIFYLISYFFFAEFLTSVGETVNGTDVFIMLFTRNGLRSSTGGVTLFNNNAADFKILCIWFVYMVVPLLIMLIVSLLFKESDDISDGKAEYLNLLPHLNTKERLLFLENYFSNQNREYVTNYLQINQSVSIIRDYSAGSNATTMLCMDEKEMFFRKCAFGEEREKLNQQIEWIEENYARLALPEILRKNNTELYCYYDMPYHKNAVGLFEYIHSVSVNQGWEMIRRVLGSLENSIYQVNIQPANKEIINNYVENKVKKNLEKIKRAKKIHSLLQYDTIFINGVEYRNLSYYESVLTIDHLQNIFEDDTYAVIHGDLTVENIICTKGEKESDDFYIIDPNIGNIHDSPNLDYGKLLQSIHGGYEFLMYANDVTVVNNRIDFLFTKSSVYMELHKLLDIYMKENFSEKKIRSIYYHEMIHWLRLMPYKIEKEGQRALLFYAGMLMVMNDVIEMYGEL